MSYTKSLIQSALAALVLTAGTVGFANAEDFYDAAVKNPARSENDRKRDAVDHPAEILRLTGVKPGMKVADVLAGNGYYSELLSGIVGPQGQVLMINNPPFDKWSGKALEQRLAGNRLPNVKHETRDLGDLELAANSLDAALLVKVYHDLYWVDAGGDWPKVDVPGVLDQLAKALKPGGVLLVVDHSARAGSGAADAGKLHRIDEAFAKQDFAAHGFELVSQSAVLRRPDDKRDLLSYEGPGFGKTDRFVLLFRKR